MSWSRGRDEAHKAEAAVVREAVRYVAWCREQIARGSFTDVLVPEERRFYAAVDALAKTRSAKAKKARAR